MSTKCTQERYRSMSFSRCHPSISITYLQVSYICPYSAEPPSQGFANKILKGSALRLELSGIECTAGIVDSRFSDNPNSTYRLERNQSMNQSEFKVNPCNRCQARENGLGFAADWLTRDYVSQSQSVAMHNQRNCKTTVLSTLN